MGVGYLFCGYYVPVCFKTTISLEVTKMPYLFWTDQPQPNCQTWCVLRLGTTGCVHLCVSLRLEIRFGFKSAQICGLLLLHRGSLSLGHSHRNATMSLFYASNMFLFLIYLNCCCTVHLTQLCVYRSRGCYAGTRGSLSFLSTASGVLNDLSTPLSVLLICSLLTFPMWQYNFTFSQPYLMLAFPVKATECSDMIKDKSK